MFDDDRVLPEREAKMSAADVPPFEAWLAARPELWSAERWVQDELYGECSGGGERA